MFEEGTDGGKSHVEGFGMIWGEQQLGLAGWPYMSSNTSGSRGFAKVVLIDIIRGSWVTIERLDRGCHHHGWKINVEAG